METVGVVPLRQRAPVTIDPARHQAVIFDLDGVVTDTAGVHRAAWRRMFDAFLDERRHRTGEDRRPFSDVDYERFVDGRSRIDGVAAFLQSRGITLPLDEMRALGDRKDRYFLQSLAQDGVRPHRSTVQVVRELQARGVATAVFSASRNCAAVLDAAGLTDLFGVRVDGVVAAEMGLAGKPEPALLLESARRLGVAPDRTVVVEDAEAGVEAGRRGGFALVVGVDRTGHAQQLIDRGADVVVCDLTAVVVG